MTDQRAANRPVPARTGPSRRGFLVGGAVAMVAGAGGGIAGAALQPAPRQPPATVPAVLAAALAAEHELVAALSAGGPPAISATLAQLATDHREHASALQALIGPGRGVTEPAPTAAPPGPAPLTVAQLKAAEQRAATRAARHAGGLTGRGAVLLASISACEASHVELLS
jgi:hypothetical protein